MGHEKGKVAGRDAGENTPSIGAGSGCLFKEKGQREDERRARRARSTRGEQNSMCQGEQVSGHGVE